MNRLQQTKAVFLELRHAFGAEMSAGDVLRLAARIVAIYRNKDWEREYGGFVAKDSFFAQAVDLAMDDGGWRVLDFERVGGMLLCDELPDNHLIIEKRIESFVGRPEWPRIETVWP